MLSLRHALTKWHLFCSVQLSSSQIIEFIWARKLSIYLINHNRSMFHWFWMNFLLRHVHRTDLKCSFSRLIRFHCCSFAPYFGFHCVCMCGIALFRFNVMNYKCISFVCTCENVRIRTIFGYLVCKQHLRFSEERVSEWIWMWRARISWNCATV